ncbi:MAG: FAD-binding oxidoreductase [Rhodospirillaceae bacterium]|jgi:FAD/FMN-containing dehydrogenase|nr:FAD-binding oxidoreductase [Rhodospirillaceae bacterium]MBT5566369.1 FAD-binding oxidoreductase [Rhodospirillaceae bacterium]MBT6088462.1 FAD-binding oxidoreductase [Rhodospirillaceae bacterium]MBT6959688.1 FAD-binding oxidoreductase [Rhodospirillaceae bacterium]
MEAEKIIAQLESILGGDHVRTDDASRTQFAEDLYFSGPSPLAVVAPRSIEETQEAIGACTNAGIALLPRGGGLSYTGGYVQREEDAVPAVVLDTRRLDRIVDVNPDNMTVTVEAGCTWESVMTATAEHGLRATMFGPSTGRYSTIGGSLSNNCMFFGSAKTGTAADAVLGLEVVSADGAVVVTGSGAIKNSVPFFRNNGPDMTGLFLNDAGGLGIKVAATLRLEKIPAGQATASFSFASFETLIPAIRAIGQSGLASECLGVGPAPLGETAVNAPSLHVVCEGWTQQIADAQLAAVVEMIGAAGTAIDPVVPNFIRGNPFSFVQSPLDAKGRMQIWTHGVFPLGRVTDAYDGFMSVLRDQHTDMTALDIDASMSFACAGQAMMVEPVLYWHGQAKKLHHSGMTPVENPAPEDADAEHRDSRVRIIRDAFAAMMDNLGAAHMQYGRFYSYASVTNDETVSLLRNVKRAMDPDNLVNPGALGL